MIERVVRRWGWERVWALRVVGACVVAGAALGAVVAGAVELIAWATQ